MSQRFAYVAYKKKLTSDPRPLDAFTLGQFQAWIAECGAIASDLDMFAPDT
ncbi:hypothetical protein [Xanthomonas campestris]|uniref:hypothetical protein n=1 Tax=Xanthomonas campestris TaxID=339 RepID=UPI003CCFF5CD